MCSYIFISTHIGLYSCGFVHEYVYVYSHPRVDGIWLLKGVLFPQKTVVFDPIEYGLLVVVNLRSTPRRLHLLYSIYASGN